MNIAEIRSNQRMKTVYDLQHCETMLVFFCTTEMMGFACVEETMMVAAAKMPTNSIFLPALHLESRPVMFRYVFDISYRYKYANGIYENGTL